MNCPKCSSCDVRMHNTNYEGKRLYICLNKACECYFTDWQHSEIKSLTRQLAVAKKTLESLKALEYDMDFYGELYIRKSEVSTIATNGLAEIERVK